MATFKITFLAEANGDSSSAEEDKPISNLGLAQAHGRGQQIGSLYSPWNTKFGRAASAPNRTSMATAMIVAGRPSNMIVQIPALGVPSDETSVWDAGFAVGEFTDGAEDGDHYLVVGSAKAFPPMLAKFVDEENVNLRAKVRELSFSEAGGITATFEFGHIVAIDELPALESLVA